MTLWVRPSAFQYPRRRWSRIECITDRCPSLRLSNPADGKRCPSIGPFHHPTIVWVNERQEGRRTKMRSEPNRSHRLRLFFFVPPMDFLNCQVNDPHGEVGFQKVLKSVPIASD